MVTLLTKYNYIYLYIYVCILPEKRKQTIDVDYLDLI